MQITRFTRIYCLKSKIVIRLHQIQKSNVKLYQASNNPENVLQKDTFQSSYQRVLYGGSN